MYIELVVAETDLGQWQVELCRSSARRASQSFARQIVQLVCLHCTLTRHILVRSRWVVWWMQLSNFQFESLSCCLIQMARVKVPTFPSIDSWLVSWLIE